MELPQIANVVSTWARTKPLVKRVYLFGSRVRGDHGPGSDIDIAVELDPAVFQGADESGGLATWMFETKGWKEELARLIPLRIQLERSIRSRHQR
jgi:predicted nucleotidyltransferase